MTTRYIQSNITRQVRSMQACRRLQSVKPPQDWVCPACAFLAVDIRRRLTEQHQRLIRRANMETLLLINNENIPASDRRTFERRDPLNGTLVTRAAAATLQDVKRRPMRQRRPFPHGPP